MLDGFGWGGLPGEVRVLWLWLSLTAMVVVVLVVVVIVEGSVLLSIDLVSVDVSCWVKSSGCLESRFLLSDDDVVEGCCSANFDVVVVVVGGDDVVGVAVGV